MAAGLDRTTTKSTRLLAMLALVLAVALSGIVLAACGGSDGTSATTSTAGNGSGGNDDPEPLPAEGPAQGTLRMTAGPDGAMSFVPNELTATTGIYRIDIDVASPTHNFGFRDDRTLTGVLDLPDVGTTVSTRAFFPEAGDYTFVCFVPGHGGMEGVVHVSGPTVTLEQATAAAAGATP